MRPQNASHGSRKELLQDLRLGRRVLETAQKLLQLPQAPNKDLVVALGVLGHQQLWLEAITLLRSFWGSGTLRPDIFCLNACAGACSRAASWSSALQLLRHGRSDGVKLDISSVNLACSAYEKGSSWRSALTDLTAAWAAPAVEVLAYNAVTSASSSSSIWQQSSEMVEVMRQGGVEPTVVSFTATMTAQADGWLLAVAALAQLHLLRLRGDEAAANAAVAAMRWRKAMDLGCAFRDHALDLNLLGQNTMIHSMGLHSQWQMASLKLEQMGRCQLSPDVVSFNSSIAAAETSSQWNLAAVMLARLLSTTQPTSISFNSMMSAAGTSQEWRIALRLRELSTEQQASAAVEDPIGFATVLGMCQHSLQWSMAVFFLAQARRSRLATTISGQNAGLMACEQRWLQALKLFQQILGVRRDEITFAATAGACQEASQWQQVLALHSLSWKGGAAPALLLQNALHSAWRRARQWQGSIQLLVEMQEEEVLPDAVSFAATVQTCELRGEPGPAAMVLNRFSSSSTGLLRPS